MGGKLLVKKLSEVDSIQQILDTDEWKEFYDKLLTDPPKVCRDYCKKDYVHKTFNKAS